jgi:hypothetical protein
MKENKVEVAAVVEAIANAQVVCIEELSELQLALVGGGIADTILA